jgi:polyisoprenoid-binding protein YceI
MSPIDVQALPAGTWQVDKIHSSIGFAVDYIAGTFHGTFSDFDAAVADGVLNGTAKVASVQVKDENLAAHLQSPDFFDAQTHPELTFTSKTINRDGDRVTIDGELTIKGHSETAEITGTARLRHEPAAARVRAPAAQDAEVKDAWRSAALELARPACSTEPRSPAKERPSTP